MKKEILRIPQERRQVQPTTATLNSEVIFFFDCLMLSVLSSLFGQPALVIGFFPFLAFFEMEEISCKCIFLMFETKPRWGRGITYFFRVCDLFFFPIGFFSFGFDVVTNVLRFCSICFML